MIDLFMLDLFRTELESHARVLADGLASIENAGEPQTLEPLVRAAHSIKGAARMLGLDLADRLAHTMESILSAAHAGTLALSSACLHNLRLSNDLFLRLASSPPERIPDELAALRGTVEARLADMASPVPSAPAAASNAADLPLLDLFRLELENHARVLEEGLVAVDCDPSPGRIEPLMRAAHSIKGAARMVGLDPLVGLAHAMEDVLSAAQKGQLTLTSGHIDLLLAGNDAFARLSRLKPDQIPEEAARQRDLIELQAEKVAAGPPGAGPARTPSSPGPTAPLSPAEAAWQPAAGSDDAALQDPAGQAPSPFSRGTELPSTPTAVARPPTAGPEHIPPQPSHARPSTSAADPVSRDTTPTRPEDALVRVFAHNLNRLIGLSGECLVQAESLKPLDLSLRRIKAGQADLAGRIEEALEALRSGGADDAQVKLEDALRQAESLSDLIPRHIAEFGLFSHRLEGMVNRLYGEAVSSRMRPFSDGLQGFARMVRGLAKNLGKIVRFEVEGASTGVDRDILEKLEAPLTHLLRNAVDHGIEPPEERRAAGKPDEGRLVLSARHSSGMLVITVSDDGSGIDCEQLRARVVDKGYVSAAIARDLTSAELLEFLFLPGFTTKGAVSEVSGRGVGLDIVQSMARSVGGSVRVESRFGSGTTFQLQLPLTLSVLRSLLFEIAGEFYAVPLARIDRVIRIRHADALLVEDRQFCKFEGGNVGIIDARQVLQLPAAEAGPPQLNIVIVSDRLNRYGLVVDRFAGERDLVVVPFDPRLGKAPNLGAGAILEDGSPVLILDVEDLVRSADNLLTRGRIEKVGPHAAKGRHRKKRVLVVDDSLTVREVERRMLETRGYEVVVSVDGMDGWNAIQGGDFDLLITDVDMPRMDGFELVRLVRGAPRVAGMPVMIVSYKDQEEYRIQGLQAGANHYLTKSAFHEEGLFSAVRDLIGEP